MMIDYKKIVMVFSLFLIVSSGIYAQKFVRNGLYVELGGAAKYYSLNYERFLLNTNAHNVALRAGLSGMYKSSGGGSSAGFTVPISLTYLYRLKGNFLVEGGFFITPFYEYQNIYAGNGNTSGSSHYNETYLSNFKGAYLGFRAQPSLKGMFISLGLQYQSNTAEQGLNIYYLNQGFLGSLKVGYVF